ncbi:metallophosphoesterase [Roseovarius nanhaiticus]|uniref:metallophosphoesterase n=1 Tax=Roseovarius nanhaiticus TaxID=573024 RepID=UPI002490A24E|nr:metallophosphoesterase [Roseovarius nanhaiticus]
MKEASNALVLADLHLDGWLAKGRDPFASLDPAKLASLEALIIAGDLSNKPKVRWPRLLAHLSRYVDISRIYLFPGNHDYYDHVLDGEDRLARICDEAGAHFAQKRVIIIGDIRYICCTLWTDFAIGGSVEEGMYQAGKWMHDYKYIRMVRAHYRRIQPIDIARVHADHLAWLEARLAEPFAGRTIVVTHHAPLGACLEREDEISGAYASDLSVMIDKYQPDAWLYGHTHYPREVTRGKTAIRCVSIGYPHQVETIVPPVLAALEK